MALQGRSLHTGLCTFFRIRLHSAPAQAAAGAYRWIPIANLTSARSGGQRIQRPTPWPYKTKPYSFWWSFIDHTTKRLDENSKIIVVDGNIGVDKVGFAKKIAKEFDMHFLPDIDSDKIFYVGENFDLRSLNEQLPLGARFCDLQTFYEHKVPKVQLMKIGMTQINLYGERFFNYAAALDHVLNTGQGVVIVRSPWSDMIFGDTLRKFNFYSPAGHTFYENIIRKNTLWCLWKPHLVIYLDAPVSHCRELIKKRNVPWEVNSPILTDDFLRSIETVYKDKYIPHMIKYSEFLQYDVTDLPDMDIIVEDLERLNLDKAPEEADERFDDWHVAHEEDWNSYRAFLAAKRYLRSYFYVGFPWDAPEMIILGDDLFEYNKIVTQHPENWYAPGWNPEKASTWFRLA